MYEQYYGLSKRPFLPAPTLECVVEHAGYLAARDAVLRCLAGDSGICVITAPAGLGKSLLCQDLQGRIEKDATVVYLCSAQFPNRRSLLQAILFELHEDYQGLTEDEARLAAVDAIRRHGRERRGIVVMIDEAHLVSSDLLEELRVLAEPPRGGDSGMRLILVGQLEFEERLADRELDSLNQRIGCHAVIEPLTHEESAAYIAARLAWVGGAIELFAREALALIVNVCDGNPRCIHQLCDYSLMSALATGERPLSLATVKASFEDLRSLPLHWNDAALDASEYDHAVDDTVLEESLEGIDEHDFAGPIDSTSNSLPDRTPTSPAQSDGFRSTDSDVAFVEIGGGEESLFRSVAPWTRQAPESTVPLSSGPARPDAASGESLELVPDDDVLDIEGETIIDDPYARIDRVVESAFAPAIPEAPDLMRFLSQFAIDGSARDPLPPLHPDSAGTEVRSQDEEATGDEVALLETIRGLQAELRLARTAQAERIDPHAVWPILDSPRFDVIEPEYEEPPPVETCQPELETIELPSDAPTIVRPSPPADAAAIEPAARYSQLFTRIRQRRRAARERLDRDDII